MDFLENKGRINTSRNIQMLYRGSSRALTFTEQQIKLIEKATPIGTINKYGKMKMEDGSQQYVKGTRKPIQDHIKTHEESKHEDVKKKEEKILKEEKSKTSFKDDEKEKEIDSIISNYIKDGSKDSHQFKKTLMLKNAQNPDFSNLSLKYFLLYTTGFYNDLNANIRKNNLNKEQNTFIKNFDEILLKAPVYSGNKPLLRSIVLNNDKVESFLENIKVGEELTDKSYMSTTYANDVRGTFFNTDKNQTSFLLKIIKNKSGRDISKFSSIKIEKEVLFPRDSKFKIIKIKNNQITLEEI